jgi:hypothetical protein
MSKRPPVLELMDEEMVALLRKKTPAEEAWIRLSNGCIASV